MSTEPRSLKRLVRRLVRRWSRRERFTSALNQAKRDLQGLRHDLTLEDSWFIRANRLSRLFVKLETLGLRWSYLTPND